jgi:hypothetical protein
MNCLCTISTKSHLFKSRVLSDSLEKYGFETINLVVDSESYDEKTIFTKKIYLTVKDLPQSDVKLILSKYGSHSDKLRWALKPVLIKYLLETKYEKVIYVDNDIYFFSSPFTLIDKLNSSSILLTPHFYSADSEKNQNWFEANFRVGLYNAGFVGANKSAIPMLDWWKDCCIYNVKKSYWRGLYDDQKYLDLVPVLFDNVEILKDSGCNLAGWNYKNRLIKLGEADLSSVTFVHFAELTIKEFNKIENPFHPLFIEYLMMMKAIGYPLNQNDKKYSKRNILAYFYFLLWQLARKFDRFY